MRLSLPATFVLAGAAATIPSAHGRYYAGDAGGRAVLFPGRAGRTYQYCRSPTADAFDIALDFLRTPIYAGNSLLRQSEAALDEWANSIMPSNPRYAVNENSEDGTMELVIEVPGITAKELSVELEEDERMLRIQGTRNSAVHSLRSEFDQSFTLEKDIDPSTLKVTLSSGLLKITAAKKERSVKRLEIETDAREEHVTIERHDADGEETVETRDGLTITEEAP